MLGNPQGSSARRRRRVAIGGAGALPARRLSAARRQWTLGSGAGGGTHETSRLDGAAAGMAAGGRDRVGAGQWHRPDRCAARRHRGRRRVAARRAGDCGRRQPPPAARGRLVARAAGAALGVRPRPRPPLLAPRAGVPAGRRAARVRRAGVRARRGRALSAAGRGARHRRPHRRRPRPPAPDLDRARRAGRHLAGGASVLAAAARAHLPAVLGDDGAADAVPAVRLRRGLRCAATRRA